MTHLYQALLGPDWAALAPVTRHLHSPDPTVLLEGRVDIVRGRNPLARLIATLLGLPRSGPQQSALVKVSAVESGELLERWYGGRHFATLKGRSGPYLTERFGPFELRFALRVEAGILRFDPSGVRLWGLSLPSTVSPSVTATEGAVSDAHVFDVSLRLPLIGLVVHYRGKLAVATD
ncbi:DUF4166 domain-containing protein [Maricaulis sp.]|uniref:DUF4166 domain-containing protein n=1 Tax=Maricaulis sp. TaxID=1486257 RepID=UPI002B27B180|nr:DUF4166 domain-containing protein [Maricaulis sp.]